MSTLPLLLCVGVLAAAPDAPVRLAAPGFSAVNLDERAAAFYLDFFSQELAAQGGIQVTTQSEVRSLIGLERQRQLLGCSEADSACLAELGGALGVEGLVVGNVARTTSGYAVTLKVVSARDARTLASSTDRVRDDEGLLDSLTHAARRMAPQVRLALGRAAPVSAVREQRPLRDAAWLPLLGGSVLAATGGVLFGLAQGEAGRLRADDTALTSPADLDEVVSRGQALQAGGLVVAGAGVVGLGIGVGMLLLGDGDGLPQVALVPASTGGALVLGGRLP